MKFFFVRQLNFSTNFSKKIYFHSESFCVAHEILSFQPEIVIFHQILQIYSKNLATIKLDHVLKFLNHIIM